MRHVAPTSQQTFNGNIFIESLPVQSIATNVTSGALFWRSAQQARKPCQRYTQCATVGQFDPHGAIIKANFLS